MGLSCSRPDVYCKTMVLDAMTRCHSSTSAVGMGCGGGQGNPHWNNAAAAAGSSGASNSIESVPRQAPNPQQSAIDAGIGRATLAAPDLAQHRPAPPYHSGNGAEPATLPARQATTLSSEPSLGRETRSGGFSLVTSLHRTNVGQPALWAHHQLLWPRYQLTCDPME